VGARIAYSKSVFINCPFDKEYTPLFQAIVFTVFDTGFIPRCSLEIDDASIVRFSKLLRLISSCQYGIHDISRVQLDRVSKLPRFNMPLELGIFLAAKAFGNSRQKRKVCLILDTYPYRYQVYISDIAGQDPHGHSDNCRRAVSIVRNWLATSSRTRIPGGDAIWRRYQKFLKALPAILDAAQLKPNDVSFADYSRIVSAWLKNNPWQPR